MFVRLFFAAVALLFGLPCLELQYVWGQQSARATMTIRARVVEASTVTSERPLQFDTLEADHYGTTSVAPSDPRAGRFALRGARGQQVLVSLAESATFAGSEGTLRARLALHGQASQEAPPRALASETLVTLGEEGAFYLRTGGGLTSKDAPDGRYQSQATLTIAYDT